MPQAPLNPMLKSFAQQLRCAPTDAEAALWQALRGNQMAGFKFRRQHPLAGYILDFYCEALTLAVELDGGQHNDAQGIASDAQRSRALTARGLHVLRFWNNEVLQETDAVLEAIWNAVQARAALLSVTPAPPRKPRRAIASHQSVPSPLEQGVTENQS